MLFALGYSACFLGAMRVASGQTKISLPDASTGRRRSVSDLVRRVASVSPPHWTFICRACRSRKPGNWSRRRTASVHIRTPSKPALTSQRPHGADPRGRLTVSRSSWIPERQRPGALSLSPNFAASGSHSRHSRPKHHIRVRNEVPQPRAVPQIARASSHATVQRT